MIMFFSLLVHLACLQPIASLYIPAETSVIEMTLEDISKPVGRDIPMPRFRPKLPPIEQEVDPQPSIPKLSQIIKPMDLEPARVELPETLMEKITPPEIPDTPPIAASDWQRGMAGVGMAGGFGSARDYFDLVRSRIESKKKYPVQAKAMHREGRVTVRFTIDLSGETRDIAVVKSSGNRLLDRAAIQAIRNSSPLPSMPQRFFSAAEIVELTIVFELF